MSLKSEVHKLDIDILEKVSTGLNSLKSKVDKSDVYKLVCAPVYLSNLRDLGKNEVAKKTEYNKLVKKGNTIKTTDTSNLVKKLTITQRLVKFKKNY